MSLFQSESASRRGNTSARISRELSAVDFDFFIHKELGLIGRNGIEEVHHLPDVEESLDARSDHLRDFL